MPSGRRGPRSSRGADILASSSRPRIYYGWVLVVALGITTVISYGCSQYLFGVLVVPVSGEMGWDRASLSGAFSLGLAVSGIFGLAIGRFVDRHGGRLVMSIGSVLLAVSLVGLSRAHDLWAFYVWWAGGIGMAQAMTQYPVTFTVIANWFHRKRGSAMAFLTVLGGLSSPLYIPMAGILAQRLGWREMLLILALTNVVIALPLHAALLRRHPEDLGLLPDGAASDTPVTQANLFGDTLREAVRRLPFWTLAANVCLGLMGANIVFVHQIAYIAGQGHSPELAAGVAGGLGLASLPARYIFNTLSDRIGSQGLLALCGIFQAAGMAVLLLFAGSVGGLVLYVVIYGAAYGASSPLIASVRASHFGRRSFGSITAAQGVIGLLGAAAGPLAAGALYDHLSSYTLAFSLTGCLFVLAAVMMVITPKPSDWKFELLPVMPA